MKGKVTLDFDIPTTMAYINNKSAQRLSEVGIYLKGFFDKALQGPRTGRTYYIPELDKFYVASAPGEYPTVKLGHLRRSMSWVVVHGAYEQSLYIGTDIPYAIDLETYMRPFLHRGIMENAEEIRNMLRRPFA